MGAALQEIGKFEARDNNSVALEHKTLVLERGDCSIDNGRQIRSRTTKRRS